MDYSKLKTHASEASKLKTQNFLHPPIQNSKFKIQNFLHPPIQNSKFKIQNFLLLLLLLTACAPAAAGPITPPPPVFIRAAGSTSAGPLLAELAAAYQERQPNVNFDIQGGGSALGYNLLRAGQVEMALLSWPPAGLAEEVRLVPLARDGLAIIVHPATRPAGLSLADLRAIFGGRLLDWREVAGPAGPIQIVSREAGSGSREAFERLVMQEQPVTLTAVVLPNSQAVIDFVAKTPGAVGYVSAGLVLPAEGSPAPAVAVVPLEGLSPTPANLAAGYPLVRDLAVAIPASAPAHVTAFIDFALSPAGQAVVGTRWGRLGE